MASIQEFQDQLLSDGYQYSGQKEEWAKVLENTPLGDGQYHKTHVIQIRDQFAWPILRDSFISPTLVLSREVSPFPPGLTIAGTKISWTDVKLKWLGKDPRNYTQEGAFRYQDGPITQFSPGTNPGISRHYTFHVSYRPSGHLGKLNVSPLDSDCFLSFNFTKGKILDLDDHFIRKLRGFANSGQRLLFNERYLP